jgi:hypothetical protein
VLPSFPEPLAGAILAPALSSHPLAANKPKGSTLKWRFSFKNGLKVTIYKYLKIKGFYRDFSDGSLPVERIVNANPKRRPHAPSQERPGTRTGCRK